MNNLISPVKENLSADLPVEEKKLPLTDEFNFGQEDATILSFTNASSMNSEIYYTAQENISTADMLIFNENDDNTFSANGSLCENSDPEGKNGPEIPVPQSSECFSKSFFKTADDGTLLDRHIESDSDRTLRKSQWESETTGEGLSSSNYYWTTESMESLWDSDDTWSQSRSHNSWPRRKLPWKVYENLPSVRDLSELSEDFSQ